MDSSLVLPANAIQAELPQWIPMNDATFLIVSSPFWSDWYEEAAQVTVGTVAFVALMFGITGDCQCWKVYLSGISLGAFHLYSKVAKLLAVLSVGSSFILIPVFVKGANL